MIRAAIIGYGTWAERHHAATLKAHPAFEMAAVCDTNEARLVEARAGNFGLRCYTDLGHMISDADFDIAVICTPPALHVHHALPCLMAGKHIVVEKPMALGAEACRVMIDAAGDSGVMLAVYHQRRFDGDFRRASLAVPALGKLALVEIRTYSWSGDAAPYGLTPWRAEDDANGGLLYDMGSHRIDQALQLSGITPRAVLGRVAARRTAANDHYEADIIGSPGDPIVRVCGSSCARIGQGGLYMWGEDGAYLDGQLRTADGLTETPEEPNQPHILYANIAAHLNDGEDLIVTPEEAAAVVAICEAAVRSSEIGKVVGLYEYLSKRAQACRHDGASVSGPVGNGVLL